MFHAKSATVLAILCVCACFSLIAQEKSIEAQVNKDRVKLGESLIFTLKVTGVHSMNAPSLAGKDFSAHLFSYQSQSQSDYRGSYTLWEFKYSLTPLRRGQITIPAIKLPQIGLQSDPIKIEVGGGNPNVAKPLQKRSDKVQLVGDENAKLQIKLSKTKCYVGEPIELQVVLYLKRNLPSVELILRDSLERIEIQQGKLTLEGLDGKHFYSEEIQGKNDKVLLGLVQSDLMLVDRSTLLDSIKSGDLQMLEYGQDRLNGRLWYTFRFRKLLIAKQAGNVTVKAHANYLKIIDSWLGQYRQLALSSKATTIAICDPPLVGKPDGFAGHIGKYQIKTSIAVYDVKENDPFTLKIEVRGPELKHFRLPPLQNQKELARWFNLPTTMKQGKIIGNTKLFQREISAKGAGITEIPALELVYFDPMDEKYHISRSQPIPIRIRPSKVITAKDAEMAKKKETKELEAIREGMAYSYQDADVIENQHYGLFTLVASLPWALAILLPPFFYLALLIFLTIRHRIDPDARKSKKAYTKLKRDFRKLRLLKGSALTSKLLEALKRYLGSKLGISPGAITYRDAEALLAKKGVANEVRKSLDEVFSHCEAGCYAGSTGVSKESSRFLDIALKAARNIERSLK